MGHTSGGWVISYTITAAFEFLKYIGARDLYPIQSVSRYFDSGSLNYVLAQPICQQ